MVPEQIEEARQGVLYLEALCDERLDELPVHKRDQWTTGIRQLFNNVGVDLDDPQQAHVALMAAKLGVTTLMSNHPNSGKATAHMLRYLMDKSDGYEDSGKRRKFRLWLSEKIMPRD